MLELKNVTYKVKDKDVGEKTIIDDINLKLKDSKFYVITGANGSGKSTLAKIIMGIIKPTSGSIIFNGKDITNLTIDERAKLGISFAFQQPVKFKGITVKDLIEIASGRKINIDEACKYLSNVGLCARNYIDRIVNDSLSGGELKRIEIAITEARNCELSIFDEPEAGIDIWSFSSLVNVFKNLQNRNKKNITIVISHQERLFEIADEMILLENGKVLKQGSQAEVMDGRILHNQVCTKIAEDK